MRSRRRLSTGREWRLRKGVAGLIFFVFSFAKNEEKASKEKVTEIMIHHLDTDTHTHTERERDRGR